MRDVPVPDAAAEAPRRLFALTSKPVLYVANVDEGADEVPEAIAAHARGAGAGAVAISARVESELGELDDERGRRDARRARDLRVGPRAADRRAPSTCSS